MAARTFLAAGLSAAMASLAAVAYLLWLPDASALKTQNPTTTTYTALYARRMARRGKKAGTAMRWVPLAGISPHLVKAVLIAEDDRFWRHRGIDWYELNPILLANLRGEEPQRGASTISQQVARNLFLSPKRSYGRKGREMLIARHLERTLGKERLLEIYLNIVEWGEGIFGAEAAAQAYFERAAADLTPEQAVSLAAALPSPYDRNPSVEPDERLLKLRRVYLERLRLKEGGLPAAAAAPPPPVQPL